MHASSLGCSEMDCIDEVLSLQEYLSTLDHSCLPRIIQVCCGVYFQGSVYEISGSEVCLSTGDLVKVTDIQLLSVSCEDISNNARFELPLEHSGLFKLIPENLPYSTIQELVCLLPVGVDACGSFTFFSSNHLNIENLIVPAETEITVLSVKCSENGENYARCRFMSNQSASAEVLIPFSYYGEFYECENTRNYSLEEIMFSKRLCRRRFCTAKSKNCDAPLLFSPVYQIHGIMHMRKNIVKFPSTLEVDVIDVTEQYQNLTFVNPLSLKEVAAQPKEVFPTMAEVLEDPAHNPFFFSTLLTQLKMGTQLVLHRCSKTSLVLASTPSGRKVQQYFLLNLGYSGQMRRRAREFSSVYEVYMAFTRSPGLIVTVTKDFEAVEEEGIPALSVGEQLEVLSLQKMNLAGGAAQSMECLVCKRILDKDDDESEDEEEEQECEVYLPLFSPGHFVEKLSDKKKYGLTEMCMNNSLPLDVKLVTHDKTLHKNPLLGISTLRLEEVLEETTVLASLPCTDTPDQCFEMPVNWLQISFSFIPDTWPWSHCQTPALHLETVTEVTENFYHEYQKLTQGHVAPPPRPPKRKPSAGPSEKVGPKPKSLSQQIPTKELASLSLCHTEHIVAPPLPDKTIEKPLPTIPRKSDSESLAVPNMYVKSPTKRKKKRKVPTKEEDSDHDYEFVTDKYI